MKKELTLKEIQMVGLNVLLKVVQICDELGLNYSLAYGTMIGAVRHNGFIPWDDDIDIYMMREDYEKLKNYFSKNSEKLLPLKFCSVNNVINYPYQLCRISDMNYEYVQLETSDKCDIGAFIDVYPLDYCGNCIDDLVMQEKVYRKSFRDCYFYNHSFHSYDSTLKKIIKLLYHTYVKFTKNFDEIVINYEISQRKIINKYNSSNSKYVGDFYTLEDFMISKDEVKKYVYVDFEGHKLKIYACYDKILRDNYGDYMKLPPEAERVPHHDYKLYKRDK